MMGDLHSNGVLGAIAARLSAVRMPGSSWAATSGRFPGCGGKKRGEFEPEDLSGELVVQLGSVTEALNRRWYEKNSGHTVTDVQRQVFHPVHRWTAATLDGRIAATAAVFEAKFMLPWNFSEEGAAEEMLQLQHNMWVSSFRSASLSIITGGGKWVEIKINADPLYQHLLSRRKRNSGAASRAAMRLACSGSSPRDRGWKRSASSI